MIIENKKIHDLIVAKDLLVQEGRKITRDIERVEVKIKRCEDKEKKITAKVIPPKELTEKGDALAKQMMGIGDELDKIAKEINDSKLSAVPEDLKNEHLALMKEREKMERERNKVALKVQKIKDKVVPIIKKEVKPLLGKYEDIETANIKDGKVVINTFDYVEEYKKKLNR